MSSDFWQHHRLRFDPWGVDYDSPVQVGEAPDAARKVETEVEGLPWAPVRPNPATPLPDQILFIDGRRRLDARLVGSSDGQALYGAFATVAVGAVAVSLSESRAVVMPPEIRRVVAVGGTEKPPATLVPCPLGTRAELVYTDGLISEDGANDPDTPLTLVQNFMLQQEAAYAKRYTVGADTLVVRDGPLRHATPEPTLGYVKTMHKHYLPGPKVALLWELAPGERTPIFAVHSGPEKLWSWYLRSGHPDIAPEKLGYHGLHGLVRLELSGAVPLEDAKAIAHQSALLIPRFASHPYRDPRAPQNLTPVGALERELGRRMGDAALIERRVRHFLAGLGA
ncbi:MAG: hypothetical protein ACK46X_08280 [Candidatus Sericytochromatia bacterium]